MRFYFLIIITLFIFESYSQSNCYLIRDKVIHNHPKYPLINYELDNMNRYWQPIKDSICESGSAFRNTFNHKWKRKKIIKFNNKLNEYNIKSNEIWEKQSNYFKVINDSIMKIIAADVMEVVRILNDSIGCNFRYLTDSLASIESDKSSDYSDFVINRILKKYGEPLRFEYIYRKEKSSFTTTHCYFYPVEQK